MAHHQSAGNRRSAATSLSDIKKPSARETPSSLGVAGHGVELPSERGCLAAILVLSQARPGQTAKHLCVQVSPPGKQEALTMPTLSGYRKDEANPHV